ncbi:uncharacterized protein LOC142772131 [Rhipicephalus microplus]|uniref:uncharacterized protein LOC142772131 n=1 Tax=Rhipicephalus microplus TaxID=6941 RepID=UPI003F6BED55
MAASRDFCPLSLLADAALHTEAIASVDGNPSAPVRVGTPYCGDDTRRLAAPFGDGASLRNGPLALPERYAQAPPTANAPFGMHGSSSAQRSQSVPCGIDGALADFCPLSAVQPTLRPHAEQAPELSMVAAPSAPLVRQQANPPRSLFCSGNGAQGGGLFETAPLIELGDCSPSLDRAANAPTVSYEAGATTQTLLQNAVQMIQALSGAVQTLSAVPKSGHPAVMLPVPTYSGYGDRLTARDYLDSLSRYQRAMGLDDKVVLERVVPAALTDTAARWYRLSGYRAANLEEFRAVFLREFLPADYESRMRRELELRTQAPDESLQEYVRAMDELISIAEPRASNEERVERVIRQAHPTFSAYLRGGRFSDLEALAAEAKRIQGDILAARAYRPPPPASDALEPRCAWRGAMTLPQRQQPLRAAFAAATGCAWELSDRALDPFTHERRAACAAPPETSIQGRFSTQRNVGGAARRNVSYDNVASRSRQLEAAPSGNTDRDGVRCYRCRERGHIARECTGSRPPARQGNGLPGRS